MCLLVNIIFYEVQCEEVCSFGVDVSIVEVVLMLSLRVCFVIYGVDKLLVSVSSFNMVVGMCGNWLYFWEYFICD